MRTPFRFLVALTALVAAACGRTDLEIPEDVPGFDARDVPTDRVDVPNDGRRCSVNSDCDDRVFCNGNELCVAGVCQAAPPVDCNDNVDCTSDQCDETSGRCLHGPNDMLCQPGTTCDVMRGCVGGPCRTNAECSDNNVCNGEETCRGGTCVVGPPPRCDDGVGCTRDVCDPVRGCFNVPDNSICDNGSFCDGAEVCNPMIGGCQRVPPVRCDDGNDCTTDRCDDASRACVNIPRDDDGDGFVSNRCGGPDCDDANPGSHPGAMEVCGDRSDNDCNGFIDCGDRACLGTPGCGPCTPTGLENNAVACRDGRDNDCNGLVDCADPACRATTACNMCVPTGPENTSAACTDGRDNDCDGQLDCADLQCRSTPACCRPTGAENNDFQCRDGIDNNCNGLIDCMDPNCAATTACRMCTPTGPEVCNDGRDNDCNGTVDCADGVCAMDPNCRAPNDTCATAIPIAVPGRASGSTDPANNDYQATCATSNGGDVVYVMDNPVTQTVTIDTEGSNYDTVLYVRSMDCISGAIVGCDDDGGTGTTSMVRLTNLPAGRYFVIVDGWGTNHGDFQLHVTTGTREVCTNGVDDDGDGLVDCSDVADCGTDPFCMMCMPNAPEAAFCNDGRDNDCNGLIDCLDPGCAGSPACRCGGVVTPENNAAACSDGRDNDCDGVLDCADPDCNGVPVCGCVPTGAENNDFACSDGRDNDCDGLLDCADPTCAGLPVCGACVPTGAENTSAACSDGRDNDCDGARDCADPGCSGVAPCACVPAPEACNDLRDNDCDGRVDCDDPDCATNPACTPCVPTGPETNDSACSDGNDNDCDRLVDCADNDCAATAACGACMPTGLENTSAACGDGRDNDCDRLTDCADPDCRATSACTTCVAENTDALCSNGRDDDCDGLTDCLDANCAMTPTCSVCMPTGAESTDASCSDGRDNDCDRAIDCADPGCATTMACRPTPPNDTCTSPILVGVPSVTTGTTAGATANFTPVTAGFPGCNGGAGPDLVYTFNITASTPLTIDLTGGFDTVVYVRRDTCMAGTQTACNDDSGATTSSRVAFVAAPGTYYVFVDGFSANNAGNFTLTISVGLPAEVCGNGRDDNGNGLVDCADPECAAAPGCVCTPTGTENTSAACSDGRDNDCDSLIDCADSQCAATPACGGCMPSPEGTAATCSDGRDNDCDGLIDCMDPACVTLPICTPCMPTGAENTATACSDGRDNDCDSLIDCADAECAATLPCCRPTGPENTAAACGDGRDNDCDGLVDCRDPNCSATPACCRLQVEVCNDGIDNNCNGLSDCADSACSSTPACTTCMPTTTRETGVAMCTDGRDNDCDRTTDCNDSDCRPFGAGSECCDARDDNANGVIDEFSCGCNTNADCAGVGNGGRFPSSVCYANTFRVCGPACNLLGGDTFCNGILAGSHCDNASGECR